MISHSRTIVALFFLLLTQAGSAQALNWLDSRLQSAVPDDERILLDIDSDGRPDMIETWWNGKRVRWLDENGDLREGDRRGDQIADVLQVDMRGDGGYDGPGDINLKWADLDKDGIPDTQAFVRNSLERHERESFFDQGEWMILRNFDQRGVLGWMDWTRFDFDCWGHTGESNWLPNYHGNSLFLKIHSPPGDLNDLSLNWENPFIFSDPDGDGVAEMTLRWVDHPERTRWIRTDNLTGTYNEGYVSMDLDNDSGKGNESDFDLTLRGSGTRSLDYSGMVNPVPGFAGNPKFDPCFTNNDWRRITELRYLPPENAYDAIFTTPWQSMYFVFDEDDDDHRWERVELYYPTARRWVPDDPSDNTGSRRRNWTPVTEDVDPYSTGRRDTSDERPGLPAHPQADSAGDRGEFDLDNSGRGQLYIGAFDRKLHLFGAEWGAWSIDPEAAFHGGNLAFPEMPRAERVTRLVRYSDTDGNGFFDTIEHDDDGDQTVDFRICLLDYASADQPHPDVVPLIDTRNLHWQGMRDTFYRMSEDSWVEALALYRACWRRGLTRPELDRLAHASSLAERYQAAYWIKESLVRDILARLNAMESAGSLPPADKNHLESQLTRHYALGQFDQLVHLVSVLPLR